MTLPNGAKLYRWVLQVSPHLFDVAQASKAFGVPERTLWRWREQIKADSNDCHQWRHTATGEGIAPLVAVTATDGSIAPLVAEPENCHPRQYSATGGSNSLGGDLGGSSLEVSISPKPKKTRTAKPLWAGDLPIHWDDLCRSEWADFCQMRKEKRKPITPTAGKALFKKMKGWSLERISSALAHSTACSYTGLFEPDGPKNPRKSNGLTEGQNSCNELMAQYREKANEIRARDRAIEGSNADPRLEAGPSLPGMEARQ